MKPLKLSLILMTHLTIFLSSCRSMPLLEPDTFEMCSPYIVIAEWKEIIINEEVYYNTYVGKCRCKDFQVSRDNIGVVSASFDRPLEYCSNYIALRPSTAWASFRIWFEDLMIFSNQGK